jgi:uncharacterized DUF497 family protein
MAKPLRTSASMAWILRMRLLPSKTRLEEIDTRFEYGEERIQVIGIARGGVLYVIVTLRGEDSCRIISVRKATRHE